MMYAIECFYKDGVDTLYEVDGQMVTFDSRRDALESTVEVEDTGLLSWSIINLKTGEHMSAERQAA